jgi:hypothetical protein
LSKKHIVKFTANFERNLEAVEAFLDIAQAQHAFDALLTELADTVIPNLERFPGLGRPFLDRTLRSVEVSNGVEGLRRKLKRIGEGGELREYVMSHYLVLYARFDTTLYLLSIKHHRQLSFDFDSRWAQDNGV